MVDFNPTNAELTGVSSSPLCDGAIRIPQNDNFVDDGPCPVCRGDAGADRPSADYHGRQVQRRWVCVACGHRWTTNPQG